MWVESFREASFPLASPGSGIKRCHIILYFYRITDKSWRRIYSHVESVNVIILYPKKNINKTPRCADGKLWKCLKCELPSGPGVPSFNFLRERMILGRNIDLVVGDARIDDEVYVYSSICRCRVWQFQCMLLIIYQFRVLRARKT